MNRSIRLLFTITFFLLVSNVYSQPPGSELLEGKETVTAVVLAHGRGEGPDGKVVGLLRKAINKELGFYTLSLQMPVLPAKDFRAYAPTFPDAYKTIQAAIDYLSKEKGVKRIYLMGYSMGARMTTAFIGERPTSVIVGYVGVGLLEGGGKPLDANQNLASIRLPVIDIFGDKTPLDLRSAESRRSMVSDTFKQVRISGADHSFLGYDEQIVQAVVEWLKEREGKKPR